MSTDIDNEIVVSVVMITYGHSLFVKEAIEGVLSQKISFPIEFIISDDKSPDNTEEVVNEIIEKDSRAKIIRYIKHKENLGMMRNFFWSINEAKGKYIAYCEGDDVWTDILKLQKQIDFLENHNDISFCSHNVRKIDKNSKVFFEPVCEQDTITFYQPQDVFHNFFPTLSLMFRNIQLPVSNSFFEANSGDTILTALLSGYGGAAHLGFVGANYRVHKGGVYSGDNYMTNAIKSINTRKLMIKSKVFDDWQVSEINNQILRRELKVVKFCLKRLRIRDLFFFFVNRNKF